MRWWGNWNWSGSLEHIPRIVRWLNWPVSPGLNRTMRGLEPVRRIETQPMDRHIPILFGVSGRETVEFQENPGGLTQTIDYLSLRGNQTCFNHTVQIIRMRLDGMIPLMKSPDLSQKCVIFLKWVLVPSFPSWTYLVFFGHSPIKPTFTYSSVLKCEILKNILIFGIGTWNLTITVVLYPLILVKKNDGYYTIE